MKYYNPTIKEITTVEGKIAYKIKQVVTPSGLCILWNGLYETRELAQKEINSYLD